MKPLTAALTAFILLGSPALAGGIVFDFPRLIWPDASPTTPTQGCHDPATIGTSACVPDH